MLEVQTSCAPRALSRGFTLIEVLVTLVVFAMLSVAGMTVLNQSIAAKSQVDRVNQSIEQLRRTHALLKADFGQLVPRTTRDSLGRRSAAVFVGGLSFGDQPMLRFVRDGWDNPSGLERRSSLQKVEYRLQDGALVRRAYLHTDNAIEDQSIDLVMLEDVEDVEFSFFVNGQWFESWSATSDGARGLPTAIALDINTPALGEMRQVFLTSGLVL